MMNYMAKTMFSALFAGLLFGFGLAASGMTDTAKVLGFLDVFGAWDPDLLWVMGAAVLTTLMSFRFILGRKRPLFSLAFHLPNKSQIDKPLLLGAVSFGIGWGLFGYCPGPAIAALVYLQTNTFLFVFALLLGLAIGTKLTQQK